MPNANGDDQQRGLALAQRLEQTASGESAVVVVLAASWLLASVVVQALEQHEDDGPDPVDAVRVVSAQFGHCVSELMAARQATRQ